MKRFALLSLAVACLACLAPAAALPARGMLVGLFDEAETLGNPDEAFPVLKTLRVQIVRSNLYWGGRGGVARRRPQHPTDPADPAYNWTAYDQMVRDAAAAKIKVVFTFFGTPAWANGGKPWNRPPRLSRDLRNFA